MKVYAIFHGLINVIIKKVLVFLKTWSTLSTLCVLSVDQAFCKKLILITLLICSFVCHYWQWPILIKCVKYYCLCVLRWLMRPILALNCMLQIEQERSKEESSVGDALALAFRCARFCSASVILFCFVSDSTPSYEASPLCSILCNLFPRLCWYVEVFEGGFRVSLYRFFWTPWERFPTCNSP